MLRAALRTSTAPRFVRTTGRTAGLVAASRQLATTSYPGVWVTVSVPADKQAEFLRVMEVRPPWSRVCYHVSDGA